MIHLSGQSGKLQLLHTVILRNVPRFQVNNNKKNFHLLHSASVCHHVLLAFIIRYTQLYKDIENVHTDHINKTTSQYICVNPRSSLHLTLPLVYITD